MLMCPPPHLPPLAPPQIVLCTLATLLLLCVEHAFHKGDGSVEGVKAAMGVAVPTQPASWLAASLRNALPRSTLLVSPGLPLSPSPCIPTTPPRSRCAGTSCCQ